MIGCVNTLFYVVYQSDLNHSVMILPHCHLFSYVISHFHILTVLLVLVPGIYLNPSSIFPVPCSPAEESPVASVAQSGGLVSFCFSLPASRETK